jgi:hypothetical protein
MNIKYIMSQDINNKFTTNYELAQLANQQYDIAIQVGEIKNTSLRRFLVKKIPLFKPERFLNSQTLESICLFENENEGLGINFDEIKFRLAYKKISEMMIPEGENTYLTETRDKVF